VKKAQLSYFAKKSHDMFTEISSEMIPLIQPAYSTPNFLC